MVCSPPIERVEFSKLRSHPPLSISEQFRHLEKKPHTLSLSVSFLLTRPRPKQLLVLGFCRFARSGHFLQWNHTLCGLLSASLTEHPVGKVYPRRGCVRASLPHEYSSVRMDRFVSPFIRSRTAGLFPPFGSDAGCRCEQPGTNVGVDAAI